MDEVEEELSELLAEERREAQAMAEAMRGLTRLSVRHRVCFACLVFNAAEMVVAALNSGDVDHGVPSVDWPLEGRRSAH